MRGTTSSNVMLSWLSWSSTQRNQREIHGPWMGLLNYWISQCFASDEVSLLFQR